MKTRLLIYSLLLGFLPLFFIAYRYVEKRAAWERVEIQIQKITLLHETREQRQGINNLVRKEFAKSNPQFFEHLHTLSFLEKEKEALRRLFTSRSYTGNELAEQRYAFISGGENHLDFIEGNVQEQEGVQECEVALLHPVEVDIENLKELINMIEQVKGGPQLFFTDFNLAKRETPLGSEVFEIKFKILKREYRS